MPELSKAELAARFGFAMAVLNSDKELERLFSRAVSQTWTPERFQAELRNTKWFQKHGESWRNAAVQKAADPASYKASVDQVRTRVSMMAVEMGAALGGQANAQKIAEQAYQLGWDDNQLRQVLAKYVRYTDGRYLGQAAEWDQELQAYAASMGLRMSASRREHWVKNIAAGKATMDSIQAILRQEAASAFPHLADRINAGETVEQIAEPYRQTMAQLLEINPEGIGLNDPTLRGALAAKDKDGKPVLRTLYDFENDLRNDKRWAKTKNAQDAAMGTVNRVLKDMGVIA